MCTKALPSIPGYYRLRNYTISEIEDVDEGPCIVFVTYDDNDDANPLECRWAGSEINIPLTDFLTSEWDGPLRVV